MATALNIRVNVVDSDITYENNPADYVTMDLDHDYLIWTTVNTVVKDGMTHEPTEDELNEASTLISASLEVMVPNCLVMDYSHDYISGEYTHEVDGMGENKRYVFAFSFDGPTATEPRLEAWDDETHTTVAKHVLGDGTPADSMVKAVCTTLASPGASWSGTAIAGLDNYVNLNGGGGALGNVASGNATQELYANVKIVIPIAYGSPAAETFTLTCRYSYL